MRSPIRNVKGGGLEALKYKLKLIKGEPQVKQKGVSLFMAQVSDAGMRQLSL